jgi:hypothetical protein
VPSSPSVPASARLRPPPTHNTNARARTVFPLAASVERLRWRPARAGWRLGPQAAATARPRIDSCFHGLGAVSSTYTPAPSITRPLSASARPPAHGTDHATGVAPTHAAQPPPQLLLARRRSSHAASTAPFRVHSRHPVVWYTAWFFFARSRLNLQPSLRAHRRLATHHSKHNQEREEVLSPSGRDVVELNRIDQRFFTNASQSVFSWFL